MEGTYCFQDLFLPNVKSGLSVVGSAITQGSFIFAAVV